MSKAIAKCTCRVCGANFERTAIKSNRKEADDWAIWAVRNYDLCPSCYAKDKRKAEDEAGLRCEIRLSPISGFWDDGLWCIAYGDTRPLKDKLKADGWVWSDAYPTGSALLSFAARQPQKRWTKKYDLGTTADTDGAALAAALNAASDELKALGFAVTCDISDIDAAMYIDAQKRKAAEKIALDDKRGPKPQRPSWVPAGRWNGTIYGKYTKAIYVDSNKIELSAEQAEELQAYLDALDAWRKVK